MLSSSFSSIYRCLRIGLWVCAMDDTCFAYRHCGNAIRLEIVPGRHEGGGLNRLGIERPAQGIAEDVEREDEDKERSGSGGNRPPDHRIAAKFHPR